jgi:hypothetical protein
MAAVVTLQIKCRSKKKPEVSSDYTLIAQQLPARYKLAFQQIVVKL